MEKLEARLKKRKVHIVKFKWLKINNCPENVEVYRPVRGINRAEQEKIIGDPEK